MNPSASRRPASEMHSGAYSRHWLRPKASGRRAPHARWPSPHRGRRPAAASDWSWPSASRQASSSVSPWTARRLAGQRGRYQRDRAGRRGQSRFHDSDLLERQDSERLQHVGLVHRRHASRCGSCAGNTSRRRSSPGAPTCRPSPRSRCAAESPAAQRMRRRCHRNPPGRSRSRSPVPIPGRPATSATMFSQMALTIDSIM